MNLMTTDTGRSRIGNVSNTARRQTWLRFPASSGWIEDAAVGGDDTDE